MSDCTPASTQNEPHPYQMLGGWLLYIVVSDFFSLPVRIANILLKVWRTNLNADLLA